MSSATQSTAWLVTGTSRGIGLELVRQLVQSPDNLVIAACRNPGKATALNSLKATAKGTLHIIQLDVGDFDSIRASAKELEKILGDRGLDYLINNAAVYAKDTAFTLDPEELLSVLRTNVAGPALLAQTVAPFIEKGRAKKIVNISSMAGSVALVDTLPPPYDVHASYPISKAALNMLTYKQKVERPDFIFLPLCPGWVKTEMGGENAVVEVEDSAAGILKVVTSATAADSGKFVNFKGDALPW
ncbi:NAD-P-binding protein [Trametes polyzona]|nr:NAD-P-binding protein [Trametes polyzona]